MLLSRYDGDLREGIVELIDLKKFSVLHTWNPDIDAFNRSIKKIDEFKPRYIIINLGGGIQEILGIYIKKNSKFRSSIMCTGAAIAFLTGEQAPINKYVDKAYLGWLVRFLWSPKKYFKRTIKSFGLIKLFI